MSLTIKMASLLVKTLSKPVAKQIKNGVHNRPLFSKVCASSGQALHLVTTNINMRLLGHKIKEIKPLSEEEAVARGADFFGEVFIYGVSAGGVVFEYQRREKDNALKASKKAERKKAKEERLKETISRLDERINELHEQNQKVMDALNALQNVSPNEITKTTRSSILWPFR